MNFIVYIMVFLSGISALLFETLLFSQTGLALGNSMWASSVVLAGFMAGLALGNLLAGHFVIKIGHRLRAYAFIECIIGISGLALVLWLPRSAMLIRPILPLLQDVPWALNGLRLTVTFFLLLVPAGAMGFTLPLVVGVMCGHRGSFGRVLGNLYGYNTLGAVIGALIGQGYLIEHFGIGGTACWAACGNIIVASVAFIMTFRLKNADKGKYSPTKGIFPRRSLWLLTAACLSGAILLAFEIVWFRFLILFFLPASSTFSLMLAIVLSGIGIGGIVASRWLCHHGSASEYCSAIAFGAGVCAIITYWLFGNVGNRLLDHIIVQWPHMILLGLFLMLPVSFLSGMLFTLLGEILNHEAQAEVSVTGRLTFSNTIGATCGSLLGGFLLLPLLGIERSIFLLAALYGLVVLFIELSKPRPWVYPKLSLWFTGGLFILSILLFPTGIMKSHYLQRVITRLTAKEPSKVRVIREGLTETLIVLQSEIYGEPGYYRLVTNSYSMSSTSIQSRRYMQLFVYLPIAIHPNPKKALLISYGVGSTAKALTDTKPLESIDIVDISKDILNLAHIPYPDPNENPLFDSRVRIHIEDGRFFLQTSSSRFDIITCEPPPPKAAGVVNLFTREYFELIRQRLADGGIATHWLPAHSLEKKETLAIIRAFCEVFTDGTLWSGAGMDFVLMGSKNAKEQVSIKQFSKQWQDSTVFTELQSLGFECPEQLGALFIAGPKELSVMTRKVASLVDNFPKRIRDQPVAPMEMAPKYWPWFNVTETQNRFLHCPVIQRLWPPSIRKASIPFFEYQAIINEMMIGFSRSPVQELKRLDRTLSESNLQTLVLWQLGRNATTQGAARVAKSKRRGDFMIRFEEAAAFLSQRNYGEAAQIFENMAVLKPQDFWIQIYRLYATCLDGKREEALSIAHSLGIPGNQDPQLSEIWNFLNRRFRLNNEKK